MKKNENETPFSEQVKNDLLAQCFNENDDFVYEKFLELLKEAWREKLQPKS